MLYYTVNQLKAVVKNKQHQKAAKPTVLSVRRMFSTLLLTQQAIRGERIAPEGNDKKKI